MAEKEFMMKLKVDLQCKKCKKKVLKVLGKFSEIREQVIDEKQNLVIIKVVCFDPEKIRDQICCKSEGSIKTIEIPEKRENPPKPKVDKPPPKTEPQPQKPPMIGYPPQLIVVPTGTCCVPWCRPGGPCLCSRGYCGRPSACYCGCYHRRTVCDCYCGCTACDVSPCEQSWCTTM